MQACLTLLVRMVLVGNLAGVVHVPFVTVVVKVLRGESVGVVRSLSGPELVVLWVLINVLNEDVGVDGFGLGVGVSIMMGLGLVLVGILVMLVVCSLLKSLSAFLTLLRALLNLVVMFKNLRTPLVWSLDLTAFLVWNVRSRFAPLITTLMMLPSLLLT